MFYLDFFFKSIVLGNEENISLETNLILFEEKKLQILSNFQFGGNQGYLGRLHEATIGVNEEKVIGRNLE